MFTPPPPPFNARRDIGIFNVREYGAKANDSSFDSTAAFNAATAAAIAAPRGMVVIPPGQYYVNGWVIDDADHQAFHIHVLGLGMPVVRKYSDASTTPIVTVGYSTGGPYEESVRIEGICFYGNRSNRTNAGVKLHNAAYVRVVNCEFDGFTYGVQGVGALVCEVSGSDIRVCDTGIGLTFATAKANALIVEKNVIVACDIGVDLSLGSGITIRGNDFEANITAIQLGVFGDSASAVNTVIENWIEATQASSGTAGGTNTVYAIKVLANSAMNAIANNSVIVQNATNAIDIATSAGPTVLRDNGFEASYSGIKNNTGSQKVRLTGNYHEQLTNNGSALTTDSGL